MPTNISSGRKFVMKSSISICLACGSILILPVLNIFQRLGDVALGFAVGLEEAKEVLGYVFDPSELLLPFVDVHFDSLKEGEHF